MTNDVDVNLRRLAEPSVPATLSATVMARVHATAEARAAAVSPRAHPVRINPLSRWDLVARATAALISVIVAITSWLAGGKLYVEWLRDFARSQTQEMPAPGIVPHAAALAAALVIGLLLFVTAAFVPLRDNP